MFGKYLKNYQEVSKSLAGLLAALPGIAPLIYGLGIPPKKEVIFQSITVVVIIAVLVFLILSAGKIRSMNGRACLKRGLFLLSVSISFLLVHLTLYDWTVIRGIHSDCVDCPAEESVIYLPLWTEGELHRMLNEDLPSREQFFDEYIEEDAKVYLARHKLAFFVTNAVMLITYWLTLVPLTVIAMSSILLITGDIGTAKRRRPEPTRN